MTNPFKNTYKIIEASNLDGVKKYIIGYGNIFGRRWLEKDGDDWGCKENGGEFTSIEGVKAVIKLHADNLLAAKMKKFSTKILGYI